MQISDYLKVLDTVINILGPNPANSPLNPAALPRVHKRESTPPFPPSPLLIWDRSVSAGYCQIQRPERSCLGENCCCNTSYNTGGQFNARMFQCSHVLLGLFRHVPEDDLIHPFMDSKLTQRKGNLTSITCESTTHLLEQDGYKARIESPDDPVLPQNPHKRCCQSRRISPLTHEPNSSGLKRTQSNVSDELGNCR